MSDSLLNLGSTSVWRLDKTYMNWRERPKSNFDLARELVVFDGTATQLVVLSEDQPQNLEFLVTIRNKAEENQFLTDFLARKGQYERFWFTHPSNRFTLFSIVSPNANVVTLVKNNFEYRGYERIYFLLAGGDLVTRKITNLVKNDETMDIYLESPIDRQIEPSNVVLLSFMLLCRLAIDELEIRHISTEISETNIKILELVGEYDDV